MEQLKVKEKIFFYEDLILYEDELADNGIAKLNVKMVNIEAFALLLFILIYHLHFETMIYKYLPCQILGHDFDEKSEFLDYALSIKLPAIT